MHIAVLMTNTDESAFAQAHPKDGEKFQAFIREGRPDWRVSVFAVKDGEFPPSLDGIDGVLITGSPASVHDPDPWVARLLALIRQIEAARLPMFGACFGHQAIALALGGAVDPNPQGWEFGLVRTRFDGQWSPAQDLWLHAAHREQVTRLPASARCVGATPGCPIAAFEVGAHILTTQYHPEMTADFVAALVEAFADKLPGNVITRARNSLAEGVADRAAIRDTVLQFFERAPVAGYDRAASISIAVT